MSDRTQIDGEALSALMDGELSEFELRRLLARISDEPELLAIWERYHLVRAVFQPEPLALNTPRMTGTDSSSDKLSNRIMAAIEAEPAFECADSPIETSTARSATGPVWASQITRFAVAASVALAVFVGMQSLLNSPSTIEIASENSDQPIPVTAGDNVLVTVDTDAQQRLNEYIRSVSIPSRPDTSEAPFNVLFESPMLHPVSDLELVQEVERTEP